MVCSKKDDSLGNWESAWVGSGVPCHELVVVFVVLFETNECLLNQNTSAVVYVVRLDFVQVFPTVPHVPAIHLDSHSSLQEVASKQKHED